MPPKAKVAAPIDRPLSRAYLRQFKGWSTAYPPGLSDPASLRTMKNMLVNRDGSLRIRPGIRNLFRLAPGLQMVGSFEAFYLNDGRKAYLFAVRDKVTRYISFRVATKLPGDNHLTPVTLNDGGLGFDISRWPDVVNGPSVGSGVTYIKYVQIDNKIIALCNNGHPCIVFHVGATKSVPLTIMLPQPPPFPFSQFALQVSVPIEAWIRVNDGSTFTPAVHAADNAAVNSLISNDTSKNIYRLGFFYTYSNELGETAPGEPVEVKVQRPWGKWRTGIPITPDNPKQYPSPPATDPEWEGGYSSRAADQLVVRLPDTPGSPGSPNLEGAIGAGAEYLNVYMYTFTDQQPRPQEALLVARKKLVDGMTYDNAWVGIYPAMQVFDVMHPVKYWGQPGFSDSSAPPAAGQAIVAADRLVTVYDPNNAARVKWTGGQQGDYLNFAPHKGGGYKTLTSGNMQIPACVKLWQNPQSADTLTVLTMGTDGHSTAYYMAPAQVASQSDATNVMAFEETTATPGTTSPYGCEVANNALYHPLDGQLMKSTASNYNISHKEMTELISNKWTKLAEKEKIVSCFHDQRLYYLVNNPDGPELLDGFTGNELWVLDLASESPTWSRWTVQGVSLRKIEVDGLVRLAIVHSEGLGFFDPDATLDQIPLQDTVYDWNISWKMETNTQGANRAHDAWAHLQQANLALGNFQGTMRFGIRAHDVNGKPVEVSKLIRDAAPPSDDGLPWDLEDYLLIRRDLKEWRLFAESVDDLWGGFPRHSSGQLSLVQYRYTPISVNVGYEYGSVETFEYGRAELAGAAMTTNGIPTPMIETSRP